MKNILDLHGRAYISAIACKASKSNYTKTELSVINRKGFSRVNKDIFSYLSDVDFLSSTIKVDFSSSILRVLLFPIL